MNPNQINLSVDELKLRSIVVNMADNLKKSNQIISKYAIALREMPKFSSGKGAAYTAAEKLRIDNIDLLNSVKERAGSGAFSIHVLLTYAAWLEENPGKTMHDYIKTMND